MKPDPSVIFEIPFVHVAEGDPKPKGPCFYCIVGRYWGFHWRGKRVGVDIEFYPKPRLVVFDPGFNAKKKYGFHIRNYLID